MQPPRLKSLLRNSGYVALLISGFACLLYIPNGDVVIALMYGLAALASIYLIRGAPQVLRLIEAMQATSEYEGDLAFIQKGGIRCGRSFWTSANCTAPFAQLRVSKDTLVLSVRVWKRTFTFPRSSIRRLRWKRSLFCDGIQIVHDNEDFPPFILFWVSDREAMIKGLRDFGYEVYKNVV